MRVSREQAAENHERILDTATKLFRERGIDGIGVADLMKAAGLTHGGFYGHFKSKDDLVAQACARAVTRMKQNWTNVIEAAPNDPLGALADRYLSPDHRDHPGRACLIATLGTEIARQPSDVRHSVTDELKPFLDYLSGVVPGNTRSSRRRRALVSFSGLVGALILSRAVNDPVLSNEILSASASQMRDSAAKPRKQAKLKQVRTSSKPN